MSDTIVTGKTHEYTVVVKIDEFTGDLTKLAGTMEHELIRIVDVEGIATLSQYFVRALANGIEVGLRFRGLPTSNVESTGIDLVTEATDAALTAAGVKHATGRIANTLLVGV